MSSDVARIEALIAELGDSYSNAADAPQKHVRRRKKDGRVVRMLPNLALQRRTERRQPNAYDKYGPVAPIERSVSRCTSFVALLVSGTVILGVFGVVCYKLVVLWRD